ncbi:alpha/beta fold hydrolase, partial [Actinomadura fibrosa]
MTGHGDTGHGDTGHGDTGHGDTGHGDIGHGTGVLLLHALSMDSSMWAGQRIALAERGHLVLAPDLRGHGRRPLGGAAPSLDVLADDLAALLDEHGVGDAVVAGCSLGGYVAMALLRRHPGRVRALALLSARVRADTPEERDQRLRFAAAVLDPRTRDAVVAGATPRLVGATTRRAR